MSTMIGVLILTIVYIYFGIIIGNAIGYKKGYQDAIDDMKKVRNRK
jgi:hypothetical protein